MKYILLLILASCKCRGDMYICPSPRYEPAPIYKTVVKVESCASSGRCRVTFDDGTTDLLYFPNVGMKVKLNIGETK